MHSTNTDQTPNSPRRRRLGPAAAAAIAMLTLVAVPSLASAQNLQRVAIATQATSGSLVLDVNGAATFPGAPVIQWYGNFGRNQQWDIQDVAGTAYEEIINENSGMCLTTDGSNGHWLYQWPCDLHHIWQQLWKGTLNSGPWATVEPLQSADGQYLDVEGNSSSAGAHVITWSADNTNGEFFKYYELFW